MNKRISALLVCLIVVLALAVGASASLVGCSRQQPTQQNTTVKPAETSTQLAAAARAKLLISVAELAKGPTNFVILDTRDPKAYAAGHIAGAISAPWQAFATVAVGKPGDNNWGILMKPADIAAALGKLGVDTNKTIVVYSDPTGWGEDGRVLWTLSSIGIDNVKMLDGGFPAWTAAGNAASKEVPKVTATTVTAGANTLADINVTTDQVKAAVNNKTAKIVDARSKKEYDGAQDFGEKRGGHIPGAINIPFTTLFNEDGTLKGDADLQKMFADAGLKPSDEIITYCTKGIRSAYMAEVMRMVGYEKAKNYDASFYAWAGDSKLPVQK